MPNAFSFQVNIWERHSFEERTHVSKKEMPTFNLFAYANGIL